MKSETSENGEPTLTNGDLLYKLKSNESRQDNGHALFHPDHQFTGSNLIKLPTPSGEDVVLIAASHEKVSQGEIWVDKFIKDTFLKNVNDITFSSVSEKEYTANLVEVALKDVYISRIDMLMLVAELNHRCIHEGQKLSLHSLKDPAAQVAVNLEIRINKIYNAKSDSMKSGAIVKKNETRFSFRSATGLFHILVQVSKEMFNWDAYGYMQYQRL